MGCQPLPLSTCTATRDPRADIGNRDPDPRQFLASHEEPSARSCRSNAGRASSHQPITRFAPANHRARSAASLIVDIDTARHALGAACDHVAVRSGTAAAWAEQQAASVRDDPPGRIALMNRCYYGPFGRAPRHLPFRRAAMSFMRWQLVRGVLHPAFSEHPGSPWWRAVNERILRDGCEAVGLSGDLPGPPSSRTVDY